MTITARVVGETAVTTTVAFINMAAEHRSTTRFDGTHHAPLLWQQRRAMRQPVSFTMLAKDVSDLQPN